MNEQIFRERDIRGKYPEEVNEELMKRVGNAFARKTSKDIIVACDVREGSTSLGNAFSIGALDAEKTVMNIGICPQAAAINWAFELQMSLAYVTGSHLPKDQNGVKFFHSSGTIYKKEELEKIYDSVKSGEYFSGLKAVHVREEQEEIFGNYIKKITEKIMSSKKRIRVLIDCGNGANGMIAKRVFRAAGFIADVIFEEPDGNFPNRGPDPKTDPLTELKANVKKYDFGIAYDADGDRFFVVSSEGKVLTTEQLVYVFLSGLKENGDVVANVECGRGMSEVVEEFNRKVITVPVGVMHMEENTIKNNAVLGIESSQHCFLPVITPYSDAIAASMFFAKAVEDSGMKLEELIKDVHVYPASRKVFACGDSKKFEIMKTLEKSLSSKYQNINKIDGIRVDLDNGFALVRASQTEGMIRLTVEADTDEELKRLDSEFSEMIEKEL